MAYEMKMKAPVIKMRVMAIPEVVAYVAETIAAHLEKDGYEVLEVSTPKEIHGDDENWKVYVTVR